MIASLILPSFKRAELLDLGLSSILKYPPAFDFEIIVVNDGVEDDTGKVCNKYTPYFDIKYIFTGQRNAGGIRPRCPGFAINVGVRKASGEIIILSCPEIYHLNDCLNKVIPPTLNGRYLVIPESMYFDDIGLFTKHLLGGTTSSFTDILGSLTSGCVGYEAVQMPYLMAMRKEEFMAIGGYDEDFTGYAADDNDLVDRLLSVGCKHSRAEAKIVHLYHGQRCDAQLHPENPEWLRNYTLFTERQGQALRNIGKEWGKG